MRQAFSLLTAIFVILLIGSILTLALSLATAESKKTADLFLKEQARVLAKSALEYELLRISGSEFDATQCYTGENYTAFGMEVNTTIRYIGNGFKNDCTLSGANTIVTSDSNGTAMIDITVSYTDPGTGERIRYHRRTLQKP